MDMADQGETPADIHHSSRRVRARSMTEEDRAFVTRVARLLEEAAEMFRAKDQSTAALALFDAERASFDALFSMAAIDAREGEKVEGFEESENGERDDPREDEDALRTLVNATFSSRYLLDARLSLDAREDLFSRLHRRAASAVGEAHPDTATALHCLAEVYWEQARYEEALEHYGRSLKVRLKVLGEEHPDTAATLNDMANVYANLGRHADAGDAFEAAAYAYASCYGAEHDETTDAMTRAHQERAAAA